MPVYKGGDPGGVAAAVEQLRRLPVELGDSAGALSWSFSSPSGVIVCRDVGCLYSRRANGGD